jgi:hypothetical protein
MSENTLASGELSWKVFRLTEKAISLVDTGRIDDAISVVENRERLLNLLATRADITETDRDILAQTDKLNEILLQKFVDAREAMRQEIGRTHQGAEVNRAYHSGQVK